MHNESNTAKMPETVKLSKSPILKQWLIRRTFYVWYLETDRYLR